MLTNKYYSLIVSDKDGDAQLEFKFNDWDNAMEFTDMCITCGKQVLFSRVEKKGGENYDTLQAID